MKPISIPYFKGAKGIVKEEFTDYNGKRFFKDLLSGFMVSLTTLPLAIAVGIAITGGINPAIGALSGVISAIIAGIISAIFGGGPFQLSAPTSLTSAILSKIACGEFGFQGMLIATLLVGLILIICGFLKVGNVVKAIPKPALNGLILGVTFIILAYQLPSLFGYSQTSNSPVQNVISFFRYGTKNISLTTCVTSVIAIILLVATPKKINNVLPVSLVILAVTTLLFYFSPLSTPIIGQIPNDVKFSLVLNIDSMSFAMLRSIALPTLEIALLYMTQILTCGARMEETTKYTYHPNIDLIGQGIGAVVSPLLGGIHSAPDYARSTYAIKSGATTRLSAIFQSLFLLFYVFAVPKIISKIPLCAVSSIIVVFAFKMNDWKSFITYFKKRSWDSLVILFATAVSAFVLNIFFALTVGILLTFIFMLFNLSTVEVYAELKKDLKTVGLTVTGPIFFGNISDFITKLKGVNCEYERLIVNLSGVTFVDDTALDKMLEYFTVLNEEKIIYFVSCKVKVLKKIARLKFYQSFGEDKFLDNFNDAYKKYIPSKKRKPEPTKISLSSTKSKKTETEELPQQTALETAEAQTEQEVAVAKENITIEEVIEAKNLTLENEDVQLEKPKQKRKKQSLKEKTEEDKKQSQEQTTT